MLTLQAPAKINLTLEVLGNRPDGFHDIRSVIQTVSLCDTISFQPDENTTLKSDMNGWLPEKSLLSKTIKLIRENTGCSRGVSIEISKRIPLLSGMGGDSSDAAAVLKGLNQIWNLGLTPKKLKELAWQLGSDVAFFLSGGTALLEGRGEIVTPLPPVTRSWVVLMTPPGERLPGKTKLLYESLKPSHYTDGRITARMVKALKAGGDIDQSLLFNTFENVAFDIFPGLSVFREHVIKVGARNVHLAGSGPTLFTLLNSKAEADDLYTRLKQQALESYLVKTI